MLHRRGFLSGLIAAPIVMQYDSLMPVKLMRPLVVPKACAMYECIKGGSSSERAIWREIAVIHDEVMRYTEEVHLDRATYPWSWTPMSGFKPGDTITTTDFIPAIDPSNGELMRLSRPLIESVTVKGLRVNSIDPDHAKGWTAEQQHDRFYLRFADGLTEWDRRS